MPIPSARSEMSRAVIVPAPRRSRTVAMFDTPARPSGSIHCPPRASVVTATTGVAWSSFKISVMPFGSTSFRGAEATAARAPSEAGHSARHAATMPWISASLGPDFASTGRTTEYDDWSGAK